jgi:MraZ protein
MLSGVSFLNKVNMDENFEEIGFWGEFEHGVDDKGRVIIPQEFRSMLGESFVVSRGPDRAIWLFPLDIWKQEVEAKLHAPIVDRKAGFLQRMLGGRTIVKLDPQFRLAIPKLLREWAGVSTSQTVILIGQGKKIEIWSKQHWDKVNESFTSENMYDAFEAIGLSGVLDGS